MITPMDFQNKKFSGSPLGYKKNEVDDFFHDVLKEYEKLYKNYIDSNKKIENLTKLLDTYKSMEETMKKTLVVAETAAEQVKETARKEAEIIVNEANVSANEIISKATSKLDSIKLEFEQVKEEMKMFIIQSKAQLRTQLAALDANEEKTEKESI